MKLLSPNAFSEEGKRRDERKGGRGKEGAEGKRVVPELQLLLDPPVISIQ